MSKRDEDSLESFFRKAVNQSDSSFMEQDWVDMERKLDADPATSPVRISRIRTRRVVVAATTLAVMLSVYFLSLRNDRALVGEPGSTEKQAAASAVIPKQDNQAMEDAAADLLLPPMQPEQNTAVARANRPRAITRIQSSQLSSEGENTLKDIDSEAPAGEENFLADDRSQSQSGSERVAKAEESPVVDDKPDDAAIQALDDQPAEANAQQNNNEEQKKSKTPSGWSFALSVAPDFSGTSLRHYTSPGSAMGLSVGYRFLNRFNLSIGIVKSAKRYEGYGDEYTPPYGYWKARTNGVVPDEIYGSCKIIEIPLILQYDVFHGQRSRLYTGVGMSTYLMSDEAYQYRFYSPNPGADEGWSSGGDRSSYPMAIGHLSIGYERQLTGKLNAGIEPFLKVPFAGIGWSDLKLYTTGAYFNLRYTISRQRSAIDYNH